jgi:hypothetical protein
MIMDFIHSENLIQGRSRAVQEFIIKTVIPSVLAYFSFYIFVEDYTKIDAVKNMLLPTLISIFLVSILISVENDEKRDILKVLLLGSVLYFAYDVVKVIAVLNDLHKDSIIFFFNYFKFIVANLLAIVILGEFAKRFEDYFVSNQKGVK